jgi:hypothetical protein
LLVIRRNRRILLVPSQRVTGFWDLPEPFDGARLGKKLGEFRHTITYRHYRFVVREATALKVPEGSTWCTPEIATLSTTARKALRVASFDP